MSSFSYQTAVMSVALVVAVALTLGSVSLAAQTNYLIGTGIADITGPAADVNFMGYANPSQTAHGIHTRQYSRAFVIADSQDKSRTVFVSIDACMVSQLLKIEVINRLKVKYGNLYSDANVCISGIHTHSAPAGFLQYVLFDITSLGFINDTFVALVEGVVKSIDRAHASVQPGDIYMSSGELLESNINRSPTAYLNNPAQERAKYDYDTDKEMVLLRLVDAKDKPIGMINWFAVHCTSMNNTNGFISGDNKGYASYLFEREMNNEALPGKGSFVAAFAQSNLGDVSPNTRGPHCMDTGRPCDTKTSTCHGKNELCVASGPGKDMFESTKIIGENQYNKAKELWNSATKKLVGPVDFRHQFLNMSGAAVYAKGGNILKGCKPAMGYSFAAGTTDGPGAFNFSQGSTSSNPFWNLIRNILHKPSAEQVECHHPKPILLDTGEIDFPYPWAPHIVPVQLLRIGQLAIIAVPGEFTTMSGRRTRDAVTKELLSGGFSNDTKAVIAGLSNTYSDYITTFEEYQIQRYEGASTIFGPHTLEIYIDAFRNLSRAMASGGHLYPGPNPPNYWSKQLSFLPPVVMDGTPFGKKFGDVITDVLPKYLPGSSVSVTFVSASPRNDLLTESTYLTVEKKNPKGEWDVLYTDSAWETLFKWQRTSTILGESTATIRWDIPAHQAAGTYRIRHFGVSKSLFGHKTPFSGTSSTFTVLPSTSYEYYKYEALKKKYSASVKIRN